MARYRTSGKAEGGVDQEDTELMRRRGRLTGGCLDEMSLSFGCSGRMGEEQQVSLVRAGWGERAWGSGLREERIEARTRGPRVLNSSSNKRVQNRTAGTRFSPFRCVRILRRRGRGMPLAATCKLVPGRAQWPYDLQCRGSFSHRTHSAQT